MNAHAKKAAEAEPLIDLSDKVKLPARTAVVQRYAFVAASGAGKTYGASVLVEQLHGAGAQVVIMDPVGVWYGLRFASDGKSPGIQIPVIGGLHGDSEISEESAEVLADLVVERRASLVLDVSMMRKAARIRFATLFLEQLFQKKKAQRSPLHLVLEEAHQFAPQKATPEAAAMLGAAEDVARMGRNFGIGLTLITQRPQAVAKEVLNLTQCLVLLQTVGTHERKAIKEWATEIEAESEATDFLNELPKLRQGGEAFIWSPSWLRLLERVQINRKWTYNASSTPELGDDQVAIEQLPPIDLEELRGLIAAAEENVRADDPKLLRKRVRELERQLEEARASATPAVPPELVKELQEIRGDLAQLSGRLAATVGEHLDPQLHTAPKETIRQARLRESGGVNVKGDPVHQRRVYPSGQAAFVELEPAAPAAAIKPVADLNGSEVRILAVLHQLGGHDSAEAVAVNAGFKAEGGAFQRYLSTLRSGGYVDGRAGRLELTAKGAAIGKAQRKITNEEVIRGHLGSLNGSEARILSTVARVHPDAMDAGAAAAMNGFAASGGAFQRYLSTLKSRHLITREGGELRATDHLFRLGNWKP